jgi:DNA-binding NarL/FixJ family response regulator
VSKPGRLGAAPSERELEVLRGIADGKSSVEIGAELYVSEDTPGGGGCA